MLDQHFRRKIIFLAAFVSFSACLQIFQDHFIYWQESLLGEFWRLWTAHWVHVGWIHYFLNILAFICLPFIFPRATVWHFCAILLILPPLISLSFYFFLPNIEAYAGMHLSQPEHSNGTLSTTSEPTCRKVRFHLEPPQSSDATA